MRIIFSNNERTVLTVVLDTDKRYLKSFEIADGQERMARLYFPQITEGNPTYGDLERVIKFYLNDHTDLTLKHHLEYIHNNKIEFRSPYRRSLRLKITK